LSPALAWAQQVAAPTLRAGRAVGILLDGRLDEPAWREADSLAPLRQVVPVAGVIPTGATVVRVLASSSEIVIGVMAYDPAPERIVSFSKAVDSELDDEDHIRLVLDTFRDGRTGYIFAVNPSGARFDGLVSNRGESTNSAWDGLWEARTERRPDGWSVEIWIPLKSLIYASGLTTWGFNIERRIQRLQETNRWAGPTPDIELGQTSRAGELTDLPVFSLGIGVAIRPSVTVGGENTATTDVEGTFHPSLDLTQRIAGGTLASLTINTDFAETEVDTRRTNLTRFPVLFPEKRSFFLEGADVFEFGLGLQNSFGGNQVLPFFSRRIGLVSGEQVPLQVGGKLNGQVGNTSIGALAVRTGAVDRVAEGATMGVLRLKQNVLGESSVGIIATAGDPMGRADSWTGGLDFTFQTSRLGGDKNFLFGVYGVMTGREGLDGDGLATGFKIDYPNDLWDMGLTYNHIGDGFDPSIGFVPRRGINSVNGGFSFQPRIRKYGLRQCFLEVRPSWTGGLSWDWESYRLFAAPVNCQLESGDRFEFNWVPQGERLDEPFEVTDLVTIAPGAYRYTRWRLELETATKRPVSGQLTWWFGGFYDGTLHTIEAEATVRLSGSLVVELNAERNVGNLSGGGFTEDLVGGRFNVNVSPDLVFSSFLQYDTESRSLGSNSRLRWTFDPLGALFVVYNHNMAREFDDRWLFDSNQLLIKVQYTLRY
jgi:hypothetical protein